MATFLEGIESITLACTLIILLPIVALVLASRSNRVVIVGGYLVGASLLMWARAGRIWEISSGGAITVMIGAAIAATYLIVAAAPQNGRPRQAGAALAGGMLAGWLWEPCVGAQFGEILNRAETDRLWSLAAMFVYVAGALLPAILLVAAADALPRVRRLLEYRPVHRVGVAFGLVYAATVAVGWYGDLVVELFQISSR